ncbi:Elongator complex protein 5 [Umbelopsis sp. AD052]|nr:Elongator complex protein 5 [Umbelopsis sp. AD052]
MAQTSGLALERLLEDKDSARSILIIDSVQQSGNPLLLNFAGRAAQDQPLVVLCTETSPKSILKSISNHQNANITFYDAYSNPNGWNSTVPTDQLLDGKHKCHTVSQLSDLKPLVKALAEQTQAHKRCTVIIDSLAPLLFAAYDHCYQLVRSLASLATDDRRVIVMHHADISYARATAMHAPSLVESLQRLCSVTIQVEAPPQTDTSNMEHLTGFKAVDQFSYMNTNSNNTTAVAKIMWKRKSGKVLHEINAFRCDGHGISVMTAAAQETEEDLDEDLQESAGPDPTANLSFNLTLTDEQRRAKEKVVLPYLKAQNRGTVEIESSEPTMASPPPPSSGSIYYEPDAADDFDDEDPDEDLDI